MSFLPCLNTYSNPISIAIPALLTYFTFCSVCTCFLLWCICWRLFQTRPILKPSDSFKAGWQFWNWLDGFNASPTGLKLVSKLSQQFYNFLSCSFRYTTCVSYAGLGTGECSRATCKQSNLVKYGTKLEVVSIALYALHFCPACMQVCYLCKWYACAMTCILDVSTEWSLFVCGVPV